MLTWTVFLAYFVCALQGILTRCETLMVLSALCLLMTLLMTLQPYMPRWACWLLALLSSGFLAGTACAAGLAYLEFGQRIAEYGFAAAEACLLLPLNLLVMLPKRAEGGD